MSAAGKKALVNEIINILKVVTKWTKWKISITGTTKQGNEFEYEASYPL